MIESKLGQRLIGLFVFLAGSAATAWTWYSALYEGYYYPKVAALGPVFVVFGLALLLAPMDMEKFRAEHGVAKPEKWAHYSTEWKLMMVLALLAGLGNWFAISQQG